MARPIESDDAVVQEFGYKPQLRRSLKFFSMFAIAFSAISITTGIFTNFGFAIGHFGPASIWVWPIAVVGQLLIALVMAELGSRIPLAGYSYQWAARLGGPGFGFLCAICIVFSFTLGTAAVTLLLLSPLIASVLGLDAENKILIEAIALIVIVICVGANIIGVRLTARVNNISVVTEVLGTVVLGIIILIAFLVHPTHGVDFLFTTGDLQGKPWWAAFAITLLLGVYTLSGFETAADLGEEGIGASRSVPRAIIGSVLISGIAGMITLICFALAMPNLKDTVADGSPIYFITNYWLGPVFARIFLATVVYSVFALDIVLVALLGRLFFSLARDNMLPGSRILSRVNTTTQTPVNALILSFILFLAVMIFATLSPDVYGTLLSPTSILASTVYLVLVLNYAVWRSRIAHLPTAFNLGRWATPVFVAATIWLLIVLGILTFPDEFRTGDYVAGTILVVTIAYYFIFLRGKISRGEAGKSFEHSVAAQPAAGDPTR